MKKLLLLFTFISATLFAQPPLTADSIYWTPKYCDTTQSIEDCTNSWIFNGNVGDCIQPSIEFCTAVWPGMWMTDTYECCCQVASLPGSESSWNGFIGSPCQVYLDSIGFIYNDPEYVNWVFLEENILKLGDDIYIDIFGRIFKHAPSGLYIKHNKKYLKVD